MKVDSFPVGALGANCIILAGDESNRAVVVDPGGDAPQILVRLADAQLRVEAILLTHGHVDHVAGAGELVRVTGAPVYLHGADRQLFDSAGMQAAMFGLPAPEACEIGHLLEDGQRVEAGGLQITVAHTPGHSPGSVSFVVGDLCLSGDTLFAGGIGRTDLWGGDYATLERSIRERLYTLEPNTRIIPGHGPSTTVSTERQHNPFVRG